MTQNKKETSAKPTCLSLDCPERFSVCCGVIGFSLCSLCGKVFIGGKCNANEKIKDKPVSEEWDLKVFSDFCKLYKDYFKKDEIEGTDMVIGHLAVIGRDYVSSQKQKLLQELLDELPKLLGLEGTPYSNIKVHHDSYIDAYNDGFNNCFKDIRQIILKKMKVEELK